MTATGLPEDVYTKIQEVFRVTPVVLAGSGFSCGYGLPGMGELGAFLATTVGPRLVGVAAEVWEIYVEDIKKDLESGLNKISSGSAGRAEIVAVLRAQTARLIIDRTQAAETDILTADNLELQPPVRLLKRLYSGAPRNADCISVITTNYDTLLELFCDIAEIPVDTGFSGFRRRTVRKEKFFQTDYRRVITVGKSGAEIEHRPAISIRLHKPHGSITWSSSSKGPIEVINDFSDAPKAIVVPGPSKYEDALVNTLFDTIRSEMNATLTKANSLFCIGFGFNDDHLQGVIQARLQNHMPAVLITRGLTANLQKLIIDHPHIIVLSKSGDGSSCNHDGKQYTLARPLWQLDDFLQTFLE